MECQLLKAFKERHEKGRAVCALWLKLKGRKIAQEVYVENDFKASRGWMFNFVTLNNLSFRRKSNNKKDCVYSKLGAIARFHDLLRCSLDQVPLPFVVSLKSTYEEKGATRVWIRQNSAG